MYIFVIVGIFYILCQYNTTALYYACLNVSGPKELKVLVDLAMISAAGQGDLEVQKVSCLHAAATGYAPLIYEMKSDMGFNEFFPLCQAVWRALDVDSKLPEKFVCLRIFIFLAVFLSLL